MNPCLVGEIPLNGEICIPSPENRSSSKHPSVKHFGQRLEPEHREYKQSPCQTKTAIFPTKSAGSSRITTKNRKHCSRISAFRKSSALPLPSDSPPLIDRAQRVSYNCGQPTVLSRPRPSPSFFDDETEQAGSTLGCSNGRSKVRQPFPAALCPRNNPASNAAEISSIRIL